MISITTEISSFKIKNNGNLSTRKIIGENQLGGLIIISRNAVEFICLEATVSFLLVKFLKSSEDYLSTKQSESRQITISLMPELAKQVL